MRVERRLRLRAVGDLGDAAEGGEGLRQRRDAGGDEDPHVLPGHPRQHAGQRIHHVVERLVGDGLPLVAPPGEDQHVVASRGHLIDEPPDRAALSDAGLTMERDGHGLAGDDVVEGALDLAQLHLAPHEGGVRRRGGRRAATRAGLMHGESPQHGRAVGALGRGEVQERGAEGVEVDGDVGGERAGPGRLARLLGHQHRERRPLERQGSLPVRHSYSATPTACTSRRRGPTIVDVACSGAMYAGVPGGEADDAVPLGRVEHQPEVEQHHAPLGRHPHVGGLHVAVHLAGVVQRGEAEGELAEGAAHAGFVGRSGGGAVAPEHRRGALGMGGLGAGERVGEGVDAAEAGEAGATADPGEGSSEPSCLYELHGEEALRPLGEELSQRYQVRVVDPLQRAELPLQTEERVGVRVADRLQRDPLVAVPVERLVDDPHPPSPRRRSRWNRGGGAESPESKGSGREYPEVQRKEREGVSRTAHETRTRARRGSPCIDSSSTRPRSPARSRSPPPERLRVDKACRVFQADDPLAAGDFGPNDVHLRVIRHAMRTTLIRLRTNFVPELLVTVEKL